MSSVIESASNYQNDVQVEVMSQNLYVGANIFRLIAGENPRDVVDTVRQTNFPERSEQIASQIGRTEPDLIGLQEVAKIAQVDANGTKTMDLDYLTTLLQALKEQGLSYEVGVTVNNFDGSLTLGQGLTASITVRDAILYRTETTDISNPIGRNYSARAKIPFGSEELTFLRSYTSVDAVVNGGHLRFVNTHFETQNTPCVVCDDPVVCQEAQVAELVEILAVETRPVVVVGDLNSEVDEPTYRTLADAGFDNAWELAGHQEPAQTCCQIETVNNEVSQLDQHIDHIVVRAPGARQIQSEVQILGDSQPDRTRSGLWPSDHAAPYASLAIRY